MYYRLIHWMCCLLHLWTLVETLVKCICILSDKCHDDVIWWAHMMSWMMSWWCHGWCHGDVMHDVMMMWQSLHFILSLVFLDMYLFMCVGFGCLSSTFVQVLNKNGGEFLLDKNVNSIPKERKTHKPLIILAWYIKLKQAFFRVTKEALASNSI